MLTILLIYVANCIVTGNTQENFDVRLSNSIGDNLREGRLEIYYHGQWGTVCDDRFSEAGARVACASLGYGYLGAMIGNRYGGGSGPILLDEVVCNGTETGIEHCSHDQWTVHDCAHSEDVSISCVCGTRYLSGPTGTISSPNFPTTYTNNLDCYNYIFVQSGQEIVITFLAFNTEPSYDWITVTCASGSNFTSPRFSGSQIPATLTISSCYNVKVSFHTDSSDTYTGFNLTYNVAAGCVKRNFSGPSGQISSPNFPMDYTNNLDCSNYITVPSGQRIIITFQAFDTESCSGCDWVAIKCASGNNFTSPNYFGSQIPATLTIFSCSLVNVSFHTDGSDTYPGFSLQYTTIPGCTNTTQVDLCFLIDGSASICDHDPSFSNKTDNTCSNWASIVSFVYRFVSDLNIGPNDVRVAVVIFDSTARLNWNLTSYLDKNRLLEAINTNLDYVKGGRRETADGLNMMADQVFNAVDRPKALRKAIIITVERPSNLEATYASIERVHSLNITTFAIGISDADVDEHDLNILPKLSSPPLLENVTYFIPKKYSTIDTVRDQVLDQTCLRPKTATPFTTSNTTTTTTRATDVASMAATTTTTTTTTPTTASESLTMPTAESRSTTTPEPPRPPTGGISLASVGPLRGPIAGGTKVTISGNLPSETISVTGIYIGNEIRGMILEANRLWGVDQVIFATPPTDQVGNLLLKVQFSGYYPNPTIYTTFNLSTERYFTYTDNPRIWEVFPRVHLVSGGTRLTAVGSNLTSVGYAAIQAMVEVCRFSTYGEPPVCSRSTRTRPCETSSVVNREYPTELVCKMPQIDIPPDFLDILDSITVPSNLTLNYKPRTKRSTPEGFVQSLAGSNGRDTANIYLRFILDGYQGNDLNRILQDSRFYFFTAPQITSSHEVIYFDPIGETEIPIKGRHMLRGCAKEDYRVRLGKGNCLISQLTDNQLTCTPPETAPDNTNEFDYVCDKRFTIVVSIGDKIYYYRCLEYAGSPPPPGSSADNWNNPNCNWKWTQIVLIVGLVIGLVLLLIVIILIICLIVVCTRNKKLRRERAIPNNYNMLPMGVIHGSLGGNHAALNGGNAMSADYLDTELPDYLSTASDKPTIT